MNDFESDSFNVEEYIGRDSIDNLDKVQDYLDYAIFKTIKKQIPFFDEQQEKVYAQKILMDYLNGNLSSFTRQNQIRNNVKIIGKDKICNLLIKKIIQQKAFNSRVRRILTDENYNDKCITYITQCIYTGNYNQAMDSFKDNNILNSLIETYVNSFYKQNMEQRSNYEFISYSDSITEKALYNLNIECCNIEMKKGL